MKISSFEYLKAIAGDPVNHTPIWIMRQAGRYLPEYRKLREKFDFLTVCKTPELATEVTLQPLKRFPLDAAILFSDILVVPESMGMTLTFLPNHGPNLKPAVRSQKEVEGLNNSELIKNLNYVAGAINLIKRELKDNAPLIGFSGSPFTLAVYMIEGKPSRNFKYIKTMLYSDPQLLHQLLLKITEAVINYLLLQAKAGADALQIFDTWGGILPVHLFEKWSAGYILKIINVVKKETNIPITVFTKGNSHLLPSLAKTGADMIGVDWMTDLSEARKTLDPEIALQGNLDPGILYGNNKQISQGVRQVLSAIGSNTRHVFNLGHGISPDISPEKVEFLVNEVHDQSRKMKRV